MNGLTARLDKKNLLLKRKESYKGDIYNYLHVDREYIDKNRTITVDCTCIICGKEKKGLTLSKLKNTHYRCGCYRPHLFNIKHGFSTNGHVDIFYERLASMRTRCNNSECSRYPDYGGRGIKVYEHWDGLDRDSVLEFKRYLVALYPDAERMMEFEGYEVDRINNDWSYQPGNIRLTTVPEQNRNTRANINSMYQGKQYCAAELYRMLKPKVARSTFEMRLKKGIPPEIAALDVVNGQVRVTSKLAKKINEEGTP